MMKIKKFMGLIEAIVIVVIMGILSKMISIYGFCQHKKRKLRRVMKT